MLTGTRRLVLGGAFDHLRAAALGAMESESRIIEIAEGLTDS